MHIRDFFGGCGKKGMRLTLERTYGASTELPTYSTMPKAIEAMQENKHGEFLKHLSLHDFEEALNEPTSEVLLNVGGKLYNRLMIWLYVFDQHFESPQSIHWSLTKMLIEKTSFDSEMLKEILSTSGRIHVLPVIIQVYGVLVVAEWLLRILFHNYSPQFATYLKECYNTSKNPQVFNLEIYNENALSIAILKDDREFVDYLLSQNANINTSCLTHENNKQRFDNLLSRMNKDVITEAYKIKEITIIKWKREKIEQLIKTFKTEKIETHATVPEAVARIANKDSLWKDLTNDKKESALSKTVIDYQIMIQGVLYITH